LKKKSPKKKRAKNPSDNFLELKSEEEKREFLKKARIKNLFSELRQAVNIKSRSGAYEKIKGSLSGSIHLDSGEILQVEISVSPNRKIVLSKDGDIVSSSAASGDINNFKYLKEDKNAIIVEVGLNKYLQLYYLENSKEFIGNYYEQVGIREYKKAGTTVMVTN